MPQKFFDVEVHRRGRYLSAALTVVLCALVGWAIQGIGFAEANVAMVFLLGVVFVAARYGRGPGIAASIASVVVLDFAFVPSYMSLTKPFGVGELLARIRVAFRHAARRASPPSTDANFAVGELTIDHGARRVFVGQREAHLTPLEYRLLEVMARHAGKVLTHRFLLTEVWGADQLGEVQYLRMFMAGLRRKLEADPTQPRYLLTEQGVGYRLVDE